MRSQEPCHPHLIVSLLVLLLASAIPLGFVLAGDWADAQERQNPGLRIIALGDGYAAGVGAHPGFFNYLPDQGTGFAWVDPGGVPGPGKNCYQNYGGYPWKLTQLINTDGFTYNSSEYTAELWLGACIGATIDDLGAQAELISDDWWRTAQLVLISAGGDDIGFSEIMTSCVALGELAGDCDDRLANAENYLRTSFSSELETALNAVMERAPQAQLGLVGYPNFADPTADMCEKYGSQIAELHQLSESVMSNLAAKHDNWYAISVSEVLAGGGSCAPDGERDVNNLLAADAATSCGYLSQINMEVSCESFYPDASGNDAYGYTLYASDVVAKVLREYTTPIPVPPTPTLTPVPTPAPPECSGATGGTQLGLTNVGFETGDLSGWTLSEVFEGVCVIGADLFVAPYEGTKMARLGKFQVNFEELPLVGRNEISQTFVVTDPIERFAYNIYTFDHAGFDEFRYSVVATTQDGEVISSFETGSWGTFAGLRNSGWRPAILDLSEHVGKEVTLSISAGGSGRDPYPFWVYIDSGAPAASLATVQASSTTGATSTDPKSGQVRVTMPYTNRSDLTWSADLACSDGSRPGAASLWFFTESRGMWRNDDGTFTVTIEADSLNSGPFWVQMDCDDGPDSTSPVGDLYLYDPWGVVTDAATGAPISEATVTLYNVPGWTPGPGGRIAEQCQSGTGPWTQPAPTELGRVVDSFEADSDGSSPQIVLNANPTVIKSAGQFGWDPGVGCWYVVVEAEGYVTVTSPVVGTPPGVTALDLALEPLGGVVLTPTPLPSGTATPGFTPTPSPLGTATPGFTPTPLPSGTATPGFTPTPLPSGTATPGFTPTPGSTPTPGASPTPGSSSAPDPSPTPVPSVSTPAPTSVTVSATPDPLQPGASLNAPTTSIPVAQPLLSGSTPSPTITPSPAKAGGPRGGLAITGSSSAVTMLSGLWLWIAGLGFLWIGNHRRNR